MSLHASALLPRDRQQHAIPGESADRPYAWLILLIAASAAFSLAFACATPLAAFAGLGALTLRRGDALLLVGGAWLANQTVGFAFLGYGAEPDSLAWGAAIGAAALGGTIAATAACHRLSRLGAVLSGATGFLIAGAVYELALFAVAAILGGTAEFTLPILSRVLAINGVAFLALVCLDRAGAAGGAARLWASIRALAGRRA